MARVVSLYLPYLATERIRNAEGKRRRPEPAAAPTAGEQAPVTGWRPGARWARREERMHGSDGPAPHPSKAQVEADIATLPLHQRPPMRELGRRSEAAPMPFRAMPPDVGNPPNHAFADTTKLARKGSNAAEYGDNGGPLRQMVREFATMPERGRWDRDAGDTRRTPSTGVPTVKEMCGYDLEGAFWQSPHAIAGEVRSRWDHPDRFEGTTASKTSAALLTKKDRASTSSARTGRGEGQNEGAEVKPLVTTARVGQRVVIAAACPQARALGIEPGHPATSARALVPGLDLRDADPAGDAAFLHRLAVHAVRHWSPLAAPSGEAGQCDGLWIEASAAHLLGGEEAMCRRIVRMLARAGHVARVAVADTPGAAHALARHGGAALILCPPGGEGAALASLPVEALRIDEAMATRLRRLGVDTIDALAGIARAPLVRRFGRALADRLDQAMGRRSEPIEGVVPPETPIACCRFLEPIATAEAIATALGRLAGELCETLAQRGLGARRAAMLCRRVDGSDAVVAIGAARPTRDVAHLVRLLSAQIERIDPGFGIESMRLIAPRCDRLDPRPVRALDEEPEDLAALVDVLATRLGDDRLFRLGAVESDVPERSVARLGPLGDPPASHPRWPRPLRMLRRPEPLAQVMAALPDHPPVRFSWRDRLYVVARADGPERIHGEWWRAAREADAVRDYFAVEDPEGRRFWLFRRGDGADGRTGDMSWWMQGAFG